MTIVAEPIVALPSRNARVYPQGLFLAFDIRALGNRSLTMSRLVPNPVPWVSGCLPHDLAHWSGRQFLRPGCLQRIRRVVPQPVWLRGRLPGAGLPTPQVLLPDHVRRHHRAAVFLGEQFSG